MPLPSASRKANIGGTPGQNGTMAEELAAGLAAPTAVILVEGPSDQAAVCTLAERRGRDLDQERVRVVPMGGATNIGHFLEVFGPRGLGVNLAGLCDQGEEDDFRRAEQRIYAGSRIELPEPQ